MRVIKPLVVQVLWESVSLSVPVKRISVLWNTGAVTVESAWGRAKKMPLCEVRSEFADSITNAIW